MKVKALCIDATGRPSHIPKSNWVVKGEFYTIIYATLLMPQECIGFLLEEIQFTEDHLPYEYFLASRFAFSDESLSEIEKMIDICIDTHNAAEKFIEEIRNNNTH